MQLIGTGVFPPRVTTHHLSQRAPVQHVSREQMPQSPHDVVLAIWPPVRPHLSFAPLLAASVEFAKIDELSKLGAGRRKPQLRLVVRPVSQERSLPQLPFQLDMPLHGVVNAALTGHAR
jgi:hypothetical protein